MEKRHPEGTVGRTLARAVPHQFVCPQLPTNISQSSSPKSRSEWDTRKGRPYNVRCSIQPPHHVGVNIVRPPFNSKSDWQIGFDRNSSSFIKKTGVPRHSRLGFI